MAALHSKTTQKKYATRIHRKNAQKVYKGRIHIMNGRMKPINKEIWSIKKELAIK
jgi:hypothetical protein